MRNNEILVRGKKGRQLRNEVKIRETSLSAKEGKKEGRKE